MKIRIKGNSVRFRLTKSEVETLAKTGLVQETTNFPQNTFTYALKVKKGINTLEAEYHNNQITVFFPENLQKEWVVNSVVGYNNDVDWSPKDGLYLLVEKDFTCMDNTIEDQSDNYPNPKLNP